MKISYLVSCHNEVRTLSNLAVLLFHGKTDKDEIIILDDFSDDLKTQEILKVASASGATLFQHSLNNDYGAHKNFGIEKCSGDFIFQLDADELPPESLLGENLHSLIENNPNTEAFAVPRINDFRGVTEQHARQWGWRLTISPTHNRPVVNFPDYQFRVFKRDYPRISFLRRLHEKIEGYTSFLTLPPEEEYALYHDKTIETQVKTNIRYNQAFTADENKGHSVFK